MSGYLSWGATGNEGTSPGASMSWLRQDGQQVDKTDLIGRAYYTLPGTTHHLLHLYLIVSRYVISLFSQVQ